MVAAVLRGERGRLSETSQGSPAQPPWSFDPTVGSFVGVKDTFDASLLFDLRDGDVLTLDEVGLELSSFHAAQEEAARSLADLAREALRTHHIDGAGGVIAEEVRDDEGPVLQARFSVNEERKS